MMPSTDEILDMTDAQLDRLEAGYCGVTIVHACQGPPRCGLEGDDAVAAAIAGCPWCRRIIIDDDGNERVIAPGNA